MLNSFWWSLRKGDKKGINWLSWDKLTIRKGWGGMAFRDLLTFNLAMFGKQGWKFLTYPDTMVSRVFNAKYFSHGDFLRAANGHNPNYICCSI